MFPVAVAVSVVSVRFAAVAPIFNIPVAPFVNVPPPANDVEAVIVPLFV